MSENEREPEVICKICNKSIYRIFVEHIEHHLALCKHEAD